MFCKKECSWKFHEFHRKTYVLDSLFSKAAGLQACNFTKKRLQKRCFPVKFAKFLRTRILKDICKRLVLGSRLQQFRLWAIKWSLCLIFKEFSFLAILTILSSHAFPNEGNSYYVSVTLFKKWRFPLKISSINVTKSAVTWGFGHIYWRNS